MHFIILSILLAATPALAVSKIQTADIANSAVTNAKIAASTIDLTTKVTGVLPAANGGTGASAFTVGSAVFAGTSGVYAQDNSKFFYDATNHRLGLGTNAPGGTLEVNNSADTVYTGGLLLTGPLANDYQTWAVYTGSDNQLHIFNKHLGASIFAINYLGQTTLGGYAIGHPDAEVGMQNVTGETGKPSLVVKAITSQTADLQDWADASEATIAKVSVTGKGTFANLADTGLSTGIAHLDSSGNFTSSAVDLSSTDASGTIADARLPAPTTSTISSAAIDWSVLVKKGGLYAKTLSANTTFTFSNAVAGQTIIVKLLNTASNYTVTWPTMKWPSSSTPVETVGAKEDIITILYDGTNYYASSVQNF